MKFPEDFLGCARSVRSARFERFKRIIGLLAVAGLLQACSAMKIFYNQAPELAYLYIDSHLDLTGAQSLQVKDALGKLQAWHRQTQLPAYIDALQKLQQRMPADMDAAQACAVFADVRHKLMAVTAQAEPALVALVGTLTASQLVQLERKFAKGNANYRDDYLEGPPTKGRDRRYKQAVSRAERLYGRLEEQQLDFIGQRIDQSRFDAQLLYAERLRRQQDVLHTLRPLIAGQSSAEKTQLALRALVERTLKSPNPAYRDYVKTSTQDECKTFAELHNSSTPAQRSQAMETLGRYEKTFKALNAQTP
jgi:hypothetical protein